MHKIWQKILAKFKVDPGIKVATKAIQAKTELQIILVSVGLILVVGFISWSKYKSPVKVAEVEKMPLKLEVAANALDSEKMWRNYFEEKLGKAQASTTDQVQAVETNLAQTVDTQAKALQSQLTQVKEQLKFLNAEQEKQSQEITALRQAETKAPQVEKIEPANIVVNNKEQEQLDLPKSSRHFIPETAYVKAVLLGGIAVSTGLNSSSEPVPVIMRVVDRGNLPENFALDLTKCQILGSGYGDLSSERAIVRAEVLSCQESGAELIHTTKVAGLIYGDDGMNGIKGKVIQTSQKQLQNAIFGGLLSGFAATAKGQDPTLINGLGITAQGKTMGGLAKEGGFSGAANAAEKIADYYIKQAQAMSPVLLVAGGVKLDVVFTKGVALNSSDVAQKIEKQRQG